MNLQSGYLKEAKHTSVNLMKLLVEFSFLLAVFFNLINRFSTAFLYVFFACSIVYILLQKKIHFGTYLSFLVAFLLYAILACFWTVASNPFADVIRLLLKYVVFAFCLHNVIETKEDCDRYLRLFCFAGLGFGLFAVAFYGPSQFVKSIQAGERLGHEICGINPFGMYAGITFTLCLYFAKIRKKYFYYLLSVLPLILVVASSSRKALLFVFCTILFFFTFEKMQKSFLKGLGIVVALLAGLWLLLQLPAFEQIWQRLQIFFEATLQGSTTVDQSAEDRLKLMEVGLHLFRDNPLFGKGTNAFRYIASGFFTYGSEISAHNTYVDILANFGIIGAVLYYMPIVIGVWKSFKGAMREIPFFYCLFFMTAITLALLDMSYVSYHFIVPYAFNALLFRAIDLYRDDLKQKINWGISTDTLVEESSKYLKK